MKLCAHTLLIGLPLLATLLSAPASAQNVAAADALFQKGMEEMEKKNYKVACPSLRESYKLDPVPGALHALASCHMEAGEIASAVVRFDEYLRVVETLPPTQKAKHAVRAKEAKEQRAALAPQVPELTLVLPAQAPPGTRVIQDSVELSAVAMGMGLPIDPGEHVVTTQAPGGPVKEHRFTIEKGEKRRLELTMAEAPDEREKGVEPPPAPPAPVGKEPPSSEPPPEPLPPPPPPRSKVPAYVTLGAAGASAIMGTIFGVQKLNLKSEFEAAPRPELGDAINRASDIADVSFAMTAILGVAGAVLLFGNDATEEPTQAAQVKKSGAPRVFVAPHVGPSGGEMVVKVTF
jgi:hypothetical protein